MKDRRRLERFALNLPAEVQVAHPDGTEETVELVTTNICAGGAFFDTLFPLPEGIAVEIGLFLTFRQSKNLTGSRGHIRIKGVVRRSEPAGMAIAFDEDYQFTNLSEVIALRQ